MPTPEIEGADPLNGGLVSGLPPHVLGAAESPDCSNTDPADPWGMTTRSPSALYSNGTPASSQNSGMTTGDVYINDIINRVYVRGASIIMFANKDGGFSSIAGSGVSLATRMGAVSLYSGLSASAASNQYTLIVTDATVPVLWNDSAGTVANASMASTGMNCEWAEGYSNRIFVGGRRDGWFENFVSHCALNDITDWTSANNAGGFFVGGNGRPIAARATRDALYFFKRNSVWILTGTSPTDYEVENVTENTGLIAPRGHASDGQGVYFASDDGIYYVSGKNVSRISDKVRQDYLEIPDKTKIAMAFRGEKLYVFRNSSTTSPNDSAFVVAPRRKIETGEVQAIWTKWASQPFGGVDVGGTLNFLVGVTVSSSFHVFQLDCPSGVAGISPSSVPSITMTYNTPDLDFGYSGVRKNLVRWISHHKPNNATQTWTAQWFSDGVSAGSSYSFTISSAGSSTHDGANRAAVNGVSGEFLRLRLSCVGQVTLYGYEAYAEPMVSDDYPRV